MPEIQTARIQTAASRLPRLGRPSRARVADAAAALAGAALAFALLHGLDAWLAALWWLATMVVIRSDLDRFIIPDTASAAIALLGLVAAGLDPSALLSATAGGAAAFAFFWLVGAAYRSLSGREGLGHGDVKLAGACGLWLGLADQALALEIAALAALVVTLVLRRRGTEGRGAVPGALRGAAVPFGAFLAPAAWLVHVTGPVLDLALRDWALRDLVLRDLALRLG